MMNKEEIVRLLSLGETRFVDLQEGYNSRAICQSVCSFLNTNGGYVICGMESGVSDEQLSNRTNEIKWEIRENIHPHAPVFVSTRKIQDRHFLTVEIPEGKDKPFAFANQVYVRGKGNLMPITADIETVKAMIFAGQGTPTRWERMFSDEIGPEMFSRGELEQLQRVMAFQDDESLMRVLEKMSLMRQGRLTNAADILLTQNPAIRHPQIRARVVCYIEKTDDQYSDYKIFEGPALQMLEDVLRFIERNTASRAVFTENGAQREMHSQYPMKAVREGLVNAFAHRDYASYAGGIRVEIGRYSLSIWNSGKLPDGITLKTLKTGHVSVLRNPDIANYFYTRRYMEMLGRGSILIQQECEKAGTKEPKWEVDDLGVTLTFFAARPVSGPMSGPIPEQGMPMPGPMSEQKRPMSGPVSEELKREVRQAEEENSKISGVLKVLTICPMSQPDMAKALYLKSVSGALKRAVKLLEQKFHFIEKTIPDKVRSRKQKYQLTVLGRQYLEEMAP